MFHDCFHIYLAHFWWHYCCPADSGSFLVALLLPCRQWLISGGTTVALQTVAHFWWHYCCPADSGSFLVALLPTDLAHVWWVLLPTDLAHVWWVLCLVVLLFPCRLWFVSGRFYSFSTDLAHVWWRYCCPADSGLFLMDGAVSLQTLGQKAAHGPRGW